MPIDARQKPGPEPSGGWAELEGGKRCIGTRHGLQETTRFAKILGSCLVSVFAMGQDISTRMGRRTIVDWALRR